MRCFAAFLMLMFLPAANADEGYFIELEDFKKWPAVAQQAYVLGVTEQALAALYQFQPDAYQAVVACMENVDTDAMFAYALKYVLNGGYGEALTTLVGDGVIDYCEKNGHKLQ